MAVIDGSFEVIKLPDGIYIDVTPPQENGKKVEITDITEYLRKNSIKNCDLFEIMNELDSLTEKKRFKVYTDLSYSQAFYGNTNENEPYKLIPSADKLSLSIKFLTDNKGYKPTVREIVDKVRELKVTAPIDEGELDIILKNFQYGSSYVIARGTPMIDSKEPYIQYHFSTERNFKPHVDEEGNVDYHKLHIVANVTKGQVLATLIPGDEGVPGKDIYGEPILPRKIKPVKLRRGKNVAINESQTELYSEIDGLVKIEDGKVVVHNTFEITGNVGNSTGDIYFQGSVIVNGNVLTGFKVVAKGDVEVIGVVEGAIIESGGNVLLHRGIQGMNKSKLVASGNVVARYIENADVVAGGTVHSEAILHSNVSARGEIRVEGKKGMITGGTVRSGTEIHANIVGSHMGTVTNVEVGIDPLTWEEYQTLLRELPKMKKEADKLEQVISLLNKKKDSEGDLDEQKKQMYLSATRNKIILTNEINIKTKRLEELTIEVENRHDGKIKIKNIVYPGVRVTIGNAKYYVRDELQYVCMIKDGADVRLTPY